MSTYKRRPDGFRAVRMRGKTEVVYCVEHKEFTVGRATACNITQVWTLDGQEELHPRSSFTFMFAHEYAPMPPAVKAMFDGKPTFTEWWDAKTEAKA